jgi:uncharacterized protein YbaR (Trm112 family)
MRLPFLLIVIIVNFMDIGGALHNSVSHYFRFIRFMRTFDLIIWLKWALSELHLQLFCSGDSLKLSIADRKRVRNTAFRIWMPRFSKPYPPTKDGLICDRCKLLYQIREEIPIMLVDEAKTIEK